MLTSLISHVLIPILYIFWRLFRKLVAFQMDPTYPKAVLHQVVHNKRNHQDNLHSSKYMEADYEEIDTYIGEINY